MPISLTGLIVRQFSFNASVLTLAAIAGLALAFYRLLMPENRDDVSKEATPTPTPADAVNAGAR